MKKIKAMDAPGKSMINVEHLNLETRKEGKLKDVLVNGHDSPYVKCQCKDGEFLLSGMTEVYLK